jgi:hypothetical protein
VGFDIAALRLGEFASCIAMQQQPLPAVVVEVVMP